MPILLDASPRAVGGVAESEGLILRQTRWPAL
jgi:hypothetical protein